jgi:KDO2-lipid IV(A) lauroyltransferase
MHSALALKCYRSMVKSKGNKILLSIVKTISLLPLRVHYFIGWVLYLLLNYILKYRGKVIRSNLDNSFPNKTRAEKNKIQKGFYRNFADFILETLKLLTISKRQLTKKVRFSAKNIDDFKQHFINKENIIVLSAHQFNWEYLSIFPTLVDYNVIISYKILSNPFWEKVIKAMRQRFGGIAVDYRKTYSTMLRFKNENKLSITWICGDQMPNWEKNTLTEEHFLNQRTYFFNGINLIAKKTNSIVYFVDIKKNKRRYSIDLKLITSKPQEEENTFITKKYSELLEKVIRKNPDNWLWSHRRWKEVPDNT